MSDEKNKIAYRRLFRKTGSKKKRFFFVPIECKTMEETRRHQLERLASGFRMFSHFGFDEGIAGHITLRDPEYTSLFLGKSFWNAFQSNLCI